MHRGSRSPSGASASHKRGSATDTIPLKPQSGSAAPAASQGLECDGCVNSSLQQQKHMNSSFDGDKDSLGDGDAASSGNGIDQALAQKHHGHSDIEYSQNSTPAQRVDDVQAERKRALLHAQEMQMQKQASAHSALQRKLDQEQSIRSALDQQMHEREHMFDEAFEAQHPLGGALEGFWYNDKSNKRVRCTVKQLIFFYLFDMSLNCSWVQTRHFTILLQLTKEEYNKQLGHIDMYNSMSTKQKVHTRARSADTRRKLSRFSHFKRSSNDAADVSSIGCSSSPHAQADALRQQQQALAATLRSQMQEFRQRSARAASTGLDSTRRPEETDAHFDRRMKSLSSMSMDQICRN